MPLSANQSRTGHALASAVRRHHTVVKLRRLRVRIAGFTFLNVTPQEAAAAGVPAAEVSIEHQPSMQGVTVLGVAVAGAGLGSG